MIAAKAALVCLFIFGLTHTLCQWRRRSGSMDMAPILLGRPLGAMASLLLLARFTSWDMEGFTLWMLVFYLSLLPLHTWYLNRVLARGSNQPTREQGKSK